MRSFTNAIVSICLALFVIGISVIITLNTKQIYYNDIDKLDIEYISGLSREDIVKNYDYLIDYNMSFKAEEFELPTLPSSPEGKIHFEEVRDIFQNVKIMIIISGAVALIGGFVLFIKKNYKFLRNASILALLLPVLLAIPIAVDFNTCFILFHEIMFSNDYWIFDPNFDPVIMILPEMFFMHMGVAILLIIVFCSILLQASYRLLKKSKTQE